MDYSGMYDAFGLLKDMVNLHTLSGSGNCRTRQSRCDFKQCSWETAGKHPGNCIAPLWYESEKVKGSMVHLTIRLQAVQCSSR